MKSPIATFKRYLFLNMYAILILLLGIGVMLVPLWRFSILLLVLQIIIMLFCLKASFAILSSWSHKKREYDILIKRNQDEFRPDTFKEHMKAPCGILLSKIVLDDLGCPSRYEELKRFKEPLLKSLWHLIRPQKTVVIVDGKVQDIKRC
jgi:hypothetical protein